MRVIEILLSPLTFPLSFIYGIIICIRHWMYDIGIFKSFRFDIPLISVGNITVGGTGKTPHIEYLIEKFSSRKKIAVLSRGYKRQTKGFRYVETGDTAADAGDEPLQIKRKYPNILVVTDAKREEAIIRIQRDHPDINLILLDDAFQYRTVIPSCNIVLIDYNRPIWKDYFLPFGRLRDARFRMKQADVLVITKCPSTLSSTEKLKLKQKLNPLKKQKVYFTTFTSGELRPVFSSFSEVSPEAEAEVLAIAGIACPEPFFGEVKKRFTKTECISFPDHYQFSPNDLLKLKDLATSKDLIITTEKDSVRFLDTTLSINTEFKSKLYYIPIQIKTI